MGVMSTQTARPPVDLDWNTLGFSYVRTDERYLSHWRDGAWDAGTLTLDNVLHISEGSTALHYGQQCFEGLKAYRAADGSINLFRPDQNAARMQASCRRLLMPEVSTEQFIEACRQVVQANERWLPPYGSGGALYLRPYMIGVGDNIGVRTAPEFIFSVFCVPVGPYFKGGLTPMNFITTQFDRAAPHGTGAAKVGGNYAASLLPQLEGEAQGCKQVIFTDRNREDAVEELGGMNVFFVTRDGKLMTPELTGTILPGITRDSVIHLAQDHGIEVEERTVTLGEWREGVASGQITEIFACGTAAVIAPMGRLLSERGEIPAPAQTNGEITTWLRDQLVGIQHGTVEDPYGWMHRVL